MATLPVQLDEEALILEHIADIPLPKGVRFQRIEPSTMWEGEPAWRIYYAVSKKIPATKKHIKDLGALKDAVQDRVFALKLNKWPFVEFVETR